MNFTIGRSVLSLTLAAGLAFGAAALARAEEPAVVATINGEPVYEADIELAESYLDQQFRRLPAEQRRAAALSALIEIRLLAAEGERRELDQTEEFQRLSAFLRDRALHSAMVEAEISGAVTDEAVRARYDAEIADTPPSNEVRARHILVNTEEEARAIIGRLDEGADFEEIARESSTDTGSGAQGGDLGYFGAGQMVPEFEQAAFALDVGAHSSEPVESQFGFHVIKVEDRRVRQPPAFDQVRDQVRSLVLSERYGELVAAQREAAEIEISDPELKATVDRINSMR